MPPNFSLKKFLETLQLVKESYVQNEPGNLPDLVQKENNLAQSLHDYWGTQYFDSAELPKVVEEFEDEKQKEQLDYRRLFGSLMAVQNISSIVTEESHSYQTFTRLKKIAGEIYDDNIINNWVTSGASALYAIDNMFGHNETLTRNRIFNDESGNYFKHTPELMNCQWNDLEELAKQSSNPEIQEMAQRTIEDYKGAFSYIVATLLEHANVQYGQHEPLDAPKPTLPKL